MKLELRQLKKILEYMYIVDYIKYVDVAEWYGFKKGLQYTLTVLDYEEASNIELLYRNFEQHCNEQKFIEKLPKLSVADVQRYSNGFIIGS
jgi:hypothetical protein